MLKLHIDIGASDIVVKGIEDRVVFFVYLEGVFVLVERRVLDDHMPHLCRSCKILQIGSV